MCGQPFSTDFGTAALLLKSVAALTAPVTSGQTMIVSCTQTTGDGMNLVHFLLQKRSSLVLTTKSDIYLKELTTGSASSS